MKLFSPTSRCAVALRGQAAFTMIEIAMALAIIGFALVAIIGILPMGLDVQKNNRRETIINQDANYFIEALRSGGVGLNDLTKYVAAIVVADNSGVKYYQNPDPIFANFPIPSGLPTPEALRLTSGQTIIGLLSRPRSEGRVEAYVKALSGAASEKSPQANAIINEAAFGYRLVPEIIPYDDPADLNGSNSAVVNNLRRNLHEVRLLFRWPLLPGYEGDGRPKLGNGRQVYRVMVGGALTQNGAVPETWFFQPQIYTNAP